VMRSLAARRSIRFNFTSVAFVARMTYRIA
jgi:hypothetical protein